MFARIGAVIAHYYVEHNAENNRRAKQQMRESGLYDGQPPRYGYRRLSEALADIFV
jgi:DNA invertase Pin-like site-specific DNA recombinase